MNDDFLHRIRAEPPPQFLASLKSRLDRQEAVAARESGLRWFRAATLIALVGGAALTLALTVTWNGRNDTPMPAGGNVPPETAKVSVPPGSTLPTLNEPRPMGAAPRAPEPGGPPASAEVPGEVFVMGPSSVNASIREASRLLRLNGIVSAPVFGERASAAALAALCDGAAKPRVDIVIATRRILAQEWQACQRNGMHLAEVKLGYEVIVLARSSLYPGGPPLSTRDLFLALAPRIPDPDHPQQLIDNPHTSWAEVNSELPDQPIDVSGPPLDSPAGIAFRELLVEKGCASFPWLAALKEIDIDRYQEICLSVRTDAYHRETGDGFGHLEANPEALVLMEFKYARVDRNQVVSVPVDGVEPTMGNVYQGNYLGSRVLYLYANSTRARNVPGLRNFAWALVSNQVGSTLMPLEEKERPANRDAALTLPDMKF
jgi:phosphate transport system substrate-binding protein